MNLLNPTKVLEESIDAAKMRVHVAILKAADVKEDEAAFKSARAGWQIGFYLKSRQDALKVISVAVANDFECGSAIKDNSSGVWETYVNLDERYK
jgi:hypothetical protein